MKHRRSLAKFGVSHSHRAALLLNLFRSLVLHKKMVTTNTKAKALRPYAEKLITLAKSASNSIHNFRLLVAKTHSKDLAKLVVEEIAPKFSVRNGGYLRIIKLGNRQGDAAPISLIEMVD